MQLLDKCAAFFELDRELNEQLRGLSCHVTAEQEEQVRELTSSRFELAWDIHDAPYSNEAGAKQAEQAAKINVAFAMRPELASLPFDEDPFRAMLVRIVKDLELPAVKKSPRARTGRQPARG